MEAGAKQPRGLRMGRFNGETLATAFETAERLEHQMRQLTTALGEVRRRDLEAETFSQVETGVGNGTDPVTVAVRMPAGALIIAENIGLRLDPGVATTVALGLGDLSRPLGQCVTGGAAGLGLVAYDQEPSVACPFAVPDGLALVAVFNNPVPAAGTNCTVHVTGRRFVSAPAPPLP